MGNFENCDALTDLSEHFFLVAKSKGFHDDDQETGGMSRYVANLHGEVSELWEAYRNGILNEECDKANEMRLAGCEVLTCIEEELADILIRCLDTARKFNVDISRAVYWKDRFNQTRPFRHGGKSA